MEIKKAFLPDESIVAPIEFYKPVLNSNNQLAKGLCITDQCNFYNFIEILEKDYLLDCKQNPIPIREDRNGRKYVCGMYVTTNHSSEQVARIMLHSFGQQHSMEFYNTHRVDHINPSTPVSNKIDNLRWVTHQENMKYAGEAGVMIKKYRKPLINDICKMICDGKARAEIVEVLGVNGQLVDDIRAGRSHKSVSKQYIDNGFSYQHHPRRSREERLVEANEICRMLSEGKSNSEICHSLGVASGLVTSVSKGISYRDVSAKYGLLKS